MKIVIIYLLIIYVKTTGFKIEHVKHKGDQDVIIRKLIIEDDDKLEPKELKNKAELDQNSLSVIEILLSIDTEDSKFLEANLGQDIKTAIQKVLDMNSKELKEKAGILGIDLPIEESELRSDDDVQADDHLNIIEDISFEIEKLKQEADKLGSNYKLVIEKILELETTDSKFEALELGSDTLPAIKALLKLPTDTLKEKAAILNVILPINEQPSILSNQEQLPVQGDEAQNIADPIIEGISSSETAEFKNKAYERGKDFQIVFDKLVNLRSNDHEFVATALGSNLKEAFTRLLQISHEELKQRFPDLNVDPKQIKGLLSQDHANLTQRVDSLGPGSKSVESTLDPKDLDPKASKLDPDIQTGNQPSLAQPHVALQEKVFSPNVSFSSDISMSRTSDPENLNFQSDAVDEINQSPNNENSSIEIKSLLKKADERGPIFQLVIDELLFIDPEEPRFKAADLGPDTRTAIKNLLELPIEKLKEKAKVFGIQINENEKLSSPSKVFELEEQADEARENDGSLSNNINAFPELETLKEEAKKIGPGFYMLFEKILSLNPDSGEFEIVNLGSDMKKSLENLFLLDIEGLELLAADLGIDPHVFKTTPLFSATRKFNPEVETSDEKVYLESMKNTSPGPKELDIQGDDPEESNFFNRNKKSQAIEESGKISTNEGPKHRIRPKLKDKMSQNNELEFVKNNKQDKSIAKNNKQSQKGENSFKNQSQSKKDNRINLFSIGDDPQAPKRRITRVRLDAIRGLVLNYEAIHCEKTQSEETQYEVWVYSKKPSVPSQKYDVDGLKTLHSPIVNFKVETSPQVFIKPKKPVSEENFKGLKLTSNVSDTREQGNPKFVKNEQHDNVKKGIRLDAAIKSPYDGLQPRIVLKFTISRTGH